MFHEIPRILSTTSVFDMKHLSNISVLGKNCFMSVRLVIHFFNFKFKLAKTLIMFCESSNRCFCDDSDLRSRPYGSSCKMIRLSRCFQGFKSF